ncbi:MAG: cupin domain-containing protein [Candidatus Binatia bacterium]|nr:cupin domain-containing protein [Candidatus Binatia bacterium]
MTKEETEGQKVSCPDADVPTDPWYESLTRDMKGWRLRAETGLVVIKGRETPWYQNPQARVRYYLLPPYRSDTALQSIAVFEQIIHHHSGMHRHQGGLVIYVINGEGYTIVDNERYDWTTDDLLILPVKPGGVAHQHFNLDPDRPARWLAMIPMAFQEYLSSEVVQLKTSPDWKAGIGNKENVAATSRDPDLTGAGGKDSLRRLGDPGDSGTTLLDSFFELRNDYRRQSQTGLRVIRGKDLPWEQNRQGRMRWYLYPSKRDAAIRCMMFYVQELPPGGKSGRQHCPGGLVHYILEGHGEVEIDGTRHEWEPGDCIALPIKSTGVRYQFFNPDSRRSARYAMGTPNFFEILGVDLGSSFEQLEDAGS